MSAAGVMTSLPASLTLRDASAALETLRQAFAAESGDVWRIDAAPVIEYFQPLREWLDGQNKGQQCGW